MSLKKSFRKRSAGVLLALSLAFAVATIPSALATDPVKLDQANETRMYSYNPPYAWYGQTFTAGITGKLVEVQINENLYDSPRPVEIHTTQNIGGLWYPTTTVVATGTLPRSGYTGWRNVPLTPQPAVISGTHYAILIQGVYQYSLTGDLYGRGSVTYSSDGTTYGLDGGYDLDFRTYVYDARVPTVSLSLHAPNHTIITSTVTGATIYASTIITGIGPTPTGTVDFTFYDNNTCSGNGTAAGSVGLSGGVADPSDSQGPLTAGQYSFKAHYGGDSAYDADNSTCQGLIVSRAKLYLPLVLRN
jgi:hypothetical protein